MPVPELLHLEAKALKPARLRERRLCTKPGEYIFSAIALRSHSACFAA
jgi:hypothetical protein